MGKGERGMHKDELLTEPEKSSGATFSMFLYLFDII